MSFAPTPVACGLLAVGVAGALVGRRALVRAGVPLAAAAVTVAAGTIRWRAARHALSPLVAPVAFVVAAVFLAELLAEEGVFEAFARRAGGDLSLWALAAVTVIVLNLDAAVVLLTPLYIAVARRRDEDPIALAAQPALVACLSSCALPVSNLTNLIAVEEGRADLGLFLRMLLVPAVLATAVGYLGWRTRFRRHRTEATPGERAAKADDDAHALRFGAAVFAALVVGFIPLAALGVPHWAVAVVVLAAAALRTRRRIAWRMAPVGAIGAAAGLVVLAAATAARVDVGRLLGSGAGAGGALRIMAVGAIGANVVNNLPAFLVGLPHVHGDSSVAALLIGVDLGPVLLVSGTLSGMLWLDVVRRAGVRASARTYASVGVAAVPAFLAAAAALLVIR